MDRVRWIAFLLFIYSCQKANLKLEQPIDNQPIIEELKKAVLPEPIKYKTIQALNNCEDYSKRAYEIVTQNQKQIDDLKSENAKLTSRIVELENELKPWRAVKGFGLFLAVVGVIFAGIRIYLAIKPM